MCRNLRADEIDVRVQSIKTDNAGACKGAVLLLYKNARVDMDLLDAEYGTLGWQRTHEFKDGKLYCTVSVWDKEKQQWISREDVGTESNTEAEKGQASDSFKRACTNFLPQGRALYTAPFIYIKSSDFKYYDTGRKSNGKPVYASNDSFSVSAIDIKDNVIVNLSIRNDSTKQDVFSYSAMSQNKQQNKDESETHEETPQNNTDESKTGSQTSIAYDEALEMEFEGRKLREIYKTERAYIPTVYEIGDAKIKEAITIIEASLAKRRAERDANKGG